MKAPGFWYKNNLFSYILLPLAGFWYIGSYINKIFTKTHKTSIPIIKVGNIVAGGSGKTPTVISIAERLISFKLNVHIVSKGYRGSIKNTTQVDTSIHNFIHVGEEALLHAKIAPTWIGKKRISSINAAQKKGAEIVILDDGLQDMSIKGDLNIIVFNGYQGMGNNKLIPAGPLREPLKWSLKNSHLAIIIDEDKNQIKEMLPNEFQSLKALTSINAAIKKKLKNKKIIAFCGIGYPQKFYKFLTNIGCEIIYWKYFPDHHLYSKEIISNLIDKSEKLDSLLITTQKDHIKIPKKYKEKIFSFPIDIEFLDYTELDNALYQVINTKNKNENNN